MLFYRAVLQVILKEKIDSYSGLEFQVGRMRKPVASFKEYARWALNKLKLNIDVTAICGLYYSFFNISTQL